MTKVLPTVIRGISLKIVIFLTSVALICACAGAVAIATYASNSGLLITIAKQSFERTGVETINNTDYLLQPVAASIENLTTLIEDNITSADNPNLSRLLYEVVDLYPQVYSAYVSVQEDGHFVQVQRIDPAAKIWGPRNSPRPAGSRFVLRDVVGSGAARTDHYRYVASLNEVVSSEVIPSATYDPRVRPFYRAALGNAGRILTDIYTFASNGKPGITIARRLMRDGKVTGVVAADITLERLSAFLADQPVGAHGVALIIDAGGHIVAAPTGDRAPDGSPAATIDELAQPALEDAWHFAAKSPPTFTFVSGGRDYLAALRHFAPSFDKDWTIMEVAPVDDFVGDLKNTISRVTLFSLVIAALAGLCSLVVAERITKPLNKLTIEADRIRSLVLDGTITGSSRIREIQHLIESMAAMKVALRTLASEDTDQTAIARLIEGLGEQTSPNRLLMRVVEKVERRRARETELSLASAIQHSVLPTPDNNRNPALRSSARMRAAREIGGDFYDWVWRDENLLAFVIGDVSGKGIPAALFMASTRTAIRTMIMAGSSLLRTVEGTNQLLSENNDRCFFVTLFIGELDLDSGLLTYINAGHEPACVVDRERTIHELRPCGPALGVIADAVFEPRTARLRSGDTLVALTDGVTDAIDGAGRRFGDARLKSTLESDAADASADMVDRLFSAVDDFAGDELQFDDITCMALSYTPARRETAPCRIDYAGLPAET